MRIEAEIWDKQLFQVGDIAPFSLEPGGDVIGQAEVVSDKKGIKMIYVTIDEGHEEEVEEIFEAGRINISIASVCLGK